MRALLLEINGMLANAREERDGTTDTIKHYVARGEVEGLRNALEVLERGLHLPPVESIEKAELNQHRRWIQELEPENKALRADNAELIGALGEMIDFFSNQKLPPNYGEYRARHNELIGTARAMIEKAKGEGE